MSRIADKIAYHKGRSAELKDQIEADSVNGGPDGPVDQLYYLSNWHHERALELIAELGMAEHHALLDRLSRT